MKQIDECSIAILGGGVAGLASAIALRLKGFAVQVYERRSSVSSMGAGIVCWPNATFVLKALGVLDGLSSRVGQPRQMQRISCRGELLGTLDIRYLDSLLGYPSAAVFRDHLQIGLAARLEELGVEVSTNHRVISIENLDPLIESERSLARNVVVKFSNGHQIEPDIVLGAEGRMRSLSRQYVHGDATPRYQGFVNWIGVVEIDNTQFADMTIRDYWGIGQRFGIVPVTSQRAYWAAGAEQSQILHSKPRDREAMLTAMFHQWPQPVLDVLEHASLNAVHEVHVHDHDPAPRWYRNNVLMIGDAAHAALPTSGQGACQALEDGWHLAEVFAEQGGQSVEQLSTLFEMFQKRRMAKTCAIARTGRALARSIFESDPTRCRERDGQAKATDYAAMARGMANGWRDGLPLGESSLATNS